MNIDEKLYINKNSITYIFYKILDIFKEYKISKYIDNQYKKNILDSLYIFFLKSNDPLIVNLNLNIIKDNIKKYVQVYTINNTNLELCNFYKDKDMRNFLSFFIKNQVRSMKILTKNDLFEKFKNYLIKYIQNQDYLYIIHNSVICDDKEIKIDDIKDKLFEYIYNDDIDKFIDMYICNNACECTNQKLCTLENEIINIMNKTVIYKPTNIILNEEALLNTIQVNEEEIYNKIYTYLTSNNFDVFNMNKIYPQLFLPS